MRPEFRFERISYDVMTPAAARAILASIYEHASFRWHVERIHILKPIVFAPVFRDSPEAPSVNRIAGRPESWPSARVALVLTDVAYLIEARLVPTEAAPHGAGLTEHAAAFARCVDEKQWMRAPCLGLRNFPAEVRRIGDDEDLPPSHFPVGATPLDLGWMFYDMDRRNGRRDLFFRARIVNGAVEIPPFDSPDLAA